MSLSAKKVLHHTKKILPSFDLHDYDWNKESSRLELIALICSKLCTLYKEYELHPMGELNNLVADSIGAYIKERNAIPYPANHINGSVSKPPQLLSLNSHLQNRYNQTPSKRQLPDEFRASIEIPPGDSSIDSLKRNEEIILSTKSGDIVEDSIVKVNEKPSLRSEPNKTSSAKSLEHKKHSKKRKIENNQQPVIPENDEKARKIKSFLSVRPKSRLSQLAGLESILSTVKELVFYPVRFPHLYDHLGVTPPCGILLHGPSGCGKTTLAMSIAGELDLPFYKASGPELIGGTSGESEERIRDIFEAAIADAPSVLFIDAFDVIAAKKDSSNRAMDRRVVAQLFDSIDLLSAPEKSIQQEGNDSTIEKSKRVILIVATNKPDSLDPGVRGRFSKEIGLPVPDASARTKILQLMTSSTRLAADVDMTQLGKATPGFVGADLQALVREAGMIAVTRIVNSTLKSDTNDDNSSDSRSNEENFVQMSDFLSAAKGVQPTAKREGFAVAPNVTWADVGALAEVREELLHNVLDPIANPERFHRLGLEVPAGVLFFGPPGCGKTLLAKALANQSGANFISVKGPELLNLYVGESESRVRQVFSRARASAPCVIFFDELDALCPKRGAWGGEGGGGNGVTERVVNQLLTELDGLEVRKDVYVIAATNRLELIDEAMLRPGRLGKLLYVPLPSAEDRAAILQAISKKVQLTEDVDLRTVSNDPRCEGFSGADLAALIREAGLAVIRESSTVKAMEANFCKEDSSTISVRHFEAAFSRVRPSVAKKDRERYDLVEQLMKQGVGAVQALAKAASTIR